MFGVFHAKGDYLPLLAERLVLMHTTKFMTSTPEVEQPMSSASDERVRCAIYARTALTSGAESIEAHKNVCREVANQNGWDVMDGFSAVELALTQEMHRWSQIPTEQGCCCAGCEFFGVPLTDSIPA
jgi:hypothetical protein